MEANGKQFNLEKYLAARDETIKIIQDLALEIKAGDNESSITEMVKLKFQSIGVNQFWHPIKIRVGKNTTKSFSEKSEDGINLTENDLYFLDLGPVIHGHEADFGRTFCLGNNSAYEKIARASEMVFELTKNKWKEKVLNGIELYQFAETEAQKLGYKLNFKMDGHRLGDFPHALYFKGGIGEIDIIPQPYFWVLEILLLSADGQFGAFYEDILF